MKILIAGLAAGIALGAPAFAQQIPPVTDSKAAAACAPANLGAAVTCLERFLKPDVKETIVKSPTPDSLLPMEFYVGLWIRNNWGLWTGSPLAQSMLATRVTQPEAQSSRILQAYWLKAKGCKFDVGEVGYVVAGAAKAAAGTDPCAVTMAEATAGGRNPMPPGALPGSAAPARRGRPAAEAEAGVNDGGDQ